jgi:hypothetical protein
MHFRGGWNTMLVLLIVLLVVLPALILACSAMLDRRRRRDPLNQAVVGAGRESAFDHAADWSLEGIVIRDKTRNIRDAPNYDG